MIKKRDKEVYPELTDNILAASVFFLPLFQIASLICWVILISIWLISGQVKSTLIQLKSYPAFVMLVALYIFYLLGMLWTEDIKEGMEDLGTKILILIFPLLFSSLLFTATSYKKIYLSLVAGCSIALVVCFFHSAVLYANSGDPQKFFYTSFSFILHPTYFTMYLNLALLMICQDTFSEKEKIISNEYLRIFLFFLLITGVILLDARLAMSTVFLTLIVFSVWEAIKKKKTRQYFMRFLIQFVVVTGLFFSLLRFYNRFEQIEDVIQKKKNTEGVLDTTANVYYNSTMTRIALLKNGFTVFKNNLLTGVGTGDVIQESVNELRNSHLDYLSKHYTGAHNQYLQTAISLGIFGLILLLLSIAFPLIGYLKTKNYLAICFVIIVLLNAAGDTMLRASSLYFFTFFGCYLYVYNKKFYLSEN